MECEKLKKLFEMCAKEHFPNPKTATEKLANEAHIYNCILLSNAIHNQCHVVKKKVGEKKKRHYMGEF
jgi:hypothetical protein|uniref:Uncharacterized protein n=1 Tax=viral metagenome TaxID=1070528 RepID=A0A6C0H1K3_9ZZZZ